MTPGERGYGERFAGLRIDLFGEHAGRQGMVRHPFQDGDGFPQLLFMAGNAGQIVRIPEGADEPGIARIAGVSPMIAILLIARHAAHLIVDPERFAHGLHGGRYPGVVRRIETKGKEPPEAGVQGVVIHQLALFVSRHHATETVQVTAPQIL